MERRKRLQVVAKAAVTGTVDVVPAAADDSAPAQLTTLIFLLSQEDKPQSHRTVREISRETGIHRKKIKIGS